MDMLRFDRFTAGRYWTDDYGYPSKEADFRNLLSYSPYHNIKGGCTYPAILVTTADTDDRVVPGHSFKYTAELQHEDIGPKPHVIRIETRAGQVGQADRQDHRRGGGQICLRCQMDRPRRQMIARRRRTIAFAAAHQPKAIALSYALSFTATDPAALWAEAPTPPPFRRR